MELRLFENCDVVLDDGGNIFQVNVFIPYTIRENHDVGTLAAKVHASGLTDTHLSLQSVFLDVPL